MNKIALLGPTYHEYCTLLNNRLDLKDKNKNVLWGWTYQHTLDMLRRLKIQKEFKIYAYNSLNRTENKQYAKRIYYCYNVYKFDYEHHYTKPPHPDLVIHGHDERFTTNRGWYYINGYGRLRPPKKWTDFREYRENGSGKNLEYKVPRHPDVYWTYVIDEFECE